MSPDQRAARAEELRHEIARQWLLFAIAEAVVISERLGSGFSLTPVLGRDVWRT